MFSSPPRIRIRCLLALAAAGAVIALLGAIWAASAASRGEREEALRDAWALWLEWEPSCFELLDGERADGLSGRWRLALGALAAETLALMEEKLAAAGGGDSERGRLVADLIAGSRRSCALARGEPVAALASTVARAQAELAATRSRLVVALPMEPAESRRRAAPFDRRLAAAVSAALELARRRAGAPESGSPPATVPPPGPIQPLRTPAAPGSPISAPPAEVPDPSGAGDGISIRSASGETWAEVRRRRGERAALRFARWHPLYLEGLRPVAELRAELAGELERESLQGLRRLCVRFGRAAERVPPEVVSRAPATDLASALSGLLTAYAAAGRACAAGQTVNAWDRLSAGDRQWAMAIRAVDRLAEDPGLPQSLRRRSGGGNVPPEPRVE